MKRALLSFICCFTVSSFANYAYYCPQSILCDGVNVVTCDDHEWGDTWVPLISGMTDVLNPYFKNVGASYDPASQQVRCKFENPDSKVILLEPKPPLNLYPYFGSTFNWNWDDPSQQRATCIGSNAVCPFTNIKPHYFK